MVGSGRFYISYVFCDVSQWRCCGLEMTIFFFFEICRCCPFGFCFCFVLCMCSETHASFKRC